MPYNVNKNYNEIKNIKSKYYGQWETDKIIEKYFEDDYIGTCIEIGAYDGIKGSNTKYFEDLSWNVLCIEPNIENNESLKKNRKLFLNYACGSNNTILPLCIFKVGKNNICSSLTSLHPDERLVKEHSHLINDKYFVDVPVKTLTSILEDDVVNTSFENIKKIDFISIDTEGTELDVLKGIDFSKFDIKLLVIENNFEDENIEEYMKLNNYEKVERYKINDFFIKK